MTADSASILAMRDRRESCRVIADTLHIPEHRVWSTLRSSGRCGEFRAVQRNKGKPRPHRSEPSILCSCLERNISRNGELLLDETMDGLWIASFGDVTGKAKTTIKEAINDAIEACEAEYAI